MRTTALLAALPVALVLTTPAAPPATPDPFDLTRWDVQARSHRVEPFRGREALWLDSGIAWLTGTDFTDGVVEFDIAITEIQGFAGLVFREDGAGTGEQFYIRSHLSGKPDASQYTPMFHGITGWQIYTGAAFAAPLEFTHDRWMHMKVVVSGHRADIYLDSDEPVFSIPELLGPGGGRIGLLASTAPARFANVTVSTVDPGPLAAVEVDRAPVAETLVDAFAVSPPFAAARLDGQTRIDDAIAADWTRLATGERGIANLARLSGNRDAGDTVFAGVRLRSDSARTVVARFGFSDRVRVYLNGQLLYAGDDGWRTRDYRYLGTVGLFDELYLPLRAGANELLFAVSESFGGWALTLDLPDREGTVVEPR